MDKPVFWTQQAHDGAYLTYGPAIMDLILLQSRFIAVGTSGLLRPLEVRIKMRGYLQAWKPSIFAAGLVFSDAIVDNTIIGNQMFILRGILGKNMSRNAAISAMQMSLRSLMAITGSFLTDAYFGPSHFILFNMERGRSFYLHHVFPNGNRPRLF
ncbi:uncharacterized protein LOC131243981 [Magnolia sinica]|uniref:uncharacterized protein LOC131243981 n=1 Tax=Magnolia sinica TaxID=86752 RepID=UPI0026588C07|nr:uncharacterized protein LOC131243981 [Magnolia sinica]